MRLAPGKRVCIRLASVEGRSVLIGTYAHLRLKRSGEMTLIEEPRSQGDVN